MTLNVQRRVRLENARWQITHTPLQWSADQTAAIVCDMWDTHHCRSAARRVAEMALHMDRLIDALRRQGVFIIHAPSDTMPFYDGHPARLRAQAAPIAAFPKRPEGWCKIPEVKEPPLPVQTPQGGCDCETQCPLPAPGHWPWRRQIETIRIADQDAIAEGTEVYNLMKQRGLSRAIIMGVHTGMCILDRPFGIKRMTHAGIEMLLLRDLTDAMYSPKDPPYVNHFAGTRLIIEHIERYWCPTFTSDQLIGGKPFAFNGDRSA
jgi:hypothetical protein